jgi:hypothetical protein
MTSSPGYCVRQHRHIRPRSHTWNAHMRVYNATVYPDGRGWVVQTPFSSAEESHTATVTVGQSSLLFKATSC